ncbi:MAG: two-component regulator propeller domain-containing protein [Acidobacteriota bacterium]
MKNFIIILITIFFFKPLYSFIPNDSLTFNHISKKDGLSDDLIFSIFQDSVGYIWIGTSNGLNRYDGYRFKTFTNDPDDPGSISHNVITWICEDDDKNIWFATYGGGLSKFDYKTNKFKNHLTFGDERTINELKIINHIRSDLKKRVWISTKGEGLIIFDPGTSEVSRYGKNNGLKSDNIMSTFEDSSGNIWIATWGGGLYKFVENSGSFSRIDLGRDQKKDSSGRYIHTILEDHGKRLWVGTRESGLISYNNSTGDFKIFGTEKGDEANIGKKKISTIFFDPENGNLIWIGTESGLFIYKISENKFIKYETKSQNSGLSHNYVWSIMRDRSGLLWVGTIGGGVNLEKGGNECFGNIGHSKKQGFNLSSPSIGAIYSDPDNPAQLWVGTLGGGLNKIDLSSGRSTTFNLRDQNRENMVKNITSIFPDLSNSAILYIGTNSGLSKYNIGNGIFTNLESPLKELSDFNSIFISTLVSSEFNKQILWIGTFGGGLYKLDLNKSSLSNYMFQNESGMNTDMNRVYTIVPSHTDNNMLWLGTNKGLCRFNIRQKTFDFFSQAGTGIHALKSPVLSLNESREHPGVLWCGTGDNGLLRFDTNADSLTALTTDNGLPDNTIVSIAEEPEGTLWLGTLKGLSRLIINTGEFRNFNKCEGLLNSGYHLNASYISSDRKIFIGGSEGLDHFFPDRLNTNMTIPPIVITGIKIFGSSELPGMDEIIKCDISEITELKLPHDYNTITLSFAALDYSCPAKNQFRCRMEGLESSWKYLGTRNSVNYKNLEPGRYTFIVKGSNRDSIWNETGIKLNIYIKGSITDSFLFWLILFTLVSIILFFSFFFYKKMKRKHITSGTTIDQLLQSEIITEREKEIIALILKGKSNKEIEDELFISLGTVKNHLYNIYKKLNIKSRTQLVSLVRSEEKL